VGVEDPALWVAIASGAAAVSRPIQNTIIFFIAVHGAEPRDRSQIIDSLAKTRQFGLWSKPQWSRRKPGARPIDPPKIEQLQPQPVDDEAA
jgi:hypothetical protein